MAKAVRQENKSITQTKNQILSLVRSFPGIPDELLLERVNALRPDDPISLRMLEIYIRQLVDKNREDCRAVLGIVPRMQEVSSHQRFYVFIETTYQQTAPPPANTQKYQEWVAEEVETRLMKNFADSLISGGVDILLGGDWDMMLTVYVAKGGAIQDQMHDFVIHHVRTCPHILRTSTTMARSTTKYPKIDSPTEDADQRI